MLIGGPGVFCTQLMAPGRGGGVEGLRRVLGDTNTTYYDVVVGAVRGKDNARCLNVDGTHAPAKDRRSGWWLNCDIELFTHCRCCCIAHMERYVYNVVLGFLISRHGSPRHTLHEAQKTQQTTHTTQHKYITFMVYSSFISLNIETRCTAHLCSEVQQ